MKNKFKKEHSKNLNILFNIIVKMTKQEMWQSKTGLIMIGFQETQRESTSGYGGDFIDVRW